MDIREIKQIALQYREILIRNKIQPDIILLFGSYAKGKANKNSDIDLAIVSRYFTKNNPKISAKLNLLAYELNAPLEVVPINYFEFMKKSTTSPILNEIHKTGLVLF
jgi:predicted nucleotidyltransferase